MCQKVIYSDHNIIHRASYSDLKPQLPVYTKKGTSQLLPWGRHKFSTGQLPAARCTSLHEIYTGKWDEFFPKPVKIPLRSFLVKDIQHNLQWFHLTNDKWIQGLVARYNQEVRVYIVTLTPTESSQYYHWPRILLG